MRPELWRRAEELFDAAVQRTRGDRRAFVADVCGPDIELRQQVELLVSKDEQAGTFLEEPLLAGIDPLHTEGPLAGRQYGSYRIVSRLGSGGMGEVYRAHDSKLGRDVALKTLPDGFRRDPRRLARLQREAHTLAALNHPNIAAIYGLEELGFGDCLVLELVEGENLRGPVPIARALDYAHQVAQALEAAHETGIIHRDLKPANVKVTPKGRVKVLDFGLATAAWRGEDSGYASWASMTAPLESGAWDFGGTPGYMSPEQARGNGVDQHADIWGFGCLLYELLTGRRAFGCETLSDSVAATLESEPDWRALPVRTPGKIRELLRECLQKDAASRPSQISAVRLAIERVQHSANRRWLPVAAASLTIAVAGAAVYIGVSRLAHRGSPQPVSFNQLTDDRGEETYPSLSPEGESFVYVARASGHLDIWFRRAGARDSLNLTRDSGADNTTPVFSPDGQSIAFRSERNGGGIFVIRRGGGSVNRVVDSGYNPAWSPDGREIVYASTKFERPEIRLSFESHLTAVDVSSGRKRRIAAGTEFAMQPNWSPHGYRIAYWSVRGAQWDIWTVGANGGDPVQVTNDAALDWDPVWSPDGKFLYFASDRSGSMNLWRAPIDERTGRVSDEIEAVTTPSPYSGYMTFSRDGRRVAYVQRISTTSLQRVGFDPTREAVVGPPEPLTQGSLVAISPAVSPDGEWIAFSTQGGKREVLFVIRKDGSGLRQITDDNFRNRAPVWSPDGSRLGFYSNRSGKFEIWTIHPDGRHLEQLTHTGVGYVNYPSWSPDGRKLAYGVQNRGAYVMALDAPAEPAKTLPGLQVRNTWFAPSPFGWSPDGRKLAGFQARRDGAFTGISIYSFDSGTYERVADFGGYPKWLKDGRRLLFTDDTTATIYLVDSASRRVHSVGSDGEFANGVAISPDNRWIYFVKRTVESDIWQANLK